LKVIQLNLKIRIAVTRKKYANKHELQHECKNMDTSLVTLCVYFNIILATKSNTRAAAAALADDATA